MKIKRKTKKVPVLQNANMPQNSGVYGNGLNQLNVQGIKTMPDLNFGLTMPTTFDNYKQETRFDPYKEGFTPTVGQEDTTQYYNPNTQTPEQNTSRNQFFNSFAGTLPTGDFGYSLNTLGRSLAFNPNNLGENVTQRQKNMLQGANTGRLVAAGATALLSGAREVMGGVASQNRQNFLTAENLTNQRKQLINYNSPEQQGYGYSHLQKGTINTAQNGGFFQNGGSEVEMEEMLSGRSTTGMPEQNEGGYNAELESREFLQRNDGSVSKVAGDRHSQGGEKFMMQGGDKVISDNIKIGADDKQFFIEMGLNVTAKTTYANVIEKFRKKIGLNDIFTDQEALFKKLKANEKVEDEDTKKQNETFIGEKINEAEQKKTELSKLESFFTDLVFKKQEERKDAGGNIYKNKPIDNYADFDGKTITAQNGGKINIHFENGGFYTDSTEMNKEFQKWAKTKGLKSDEEVANHFQGYFMQQGGQVKLSDGAKAHLDNPNILSDAYLRGAYEDALKQTDATARASAMKEYEDMLSANEYVKQIKANRQKEIQGLKDSPNYLDKAKGYGKDIFGFQQGGEKLPDYSPNIFTPENSKETNPVKTVPAALINMTPYFYQGIKRLAKDVYRDFSPVNGENPYHKEVTLDNGDAVEYNTLSQYMLNRRYANIPVNPEYEKALKKVPSEDVKYLTDFKLFQQGGEQQDQQQQIMQSVAQALQQGQDPNAVLQALVEQGVPQEQAQQLIQAVVQQMQQTQAAPQQEQQTTMQQGGEVPKMQNANTDWLNTYIDSPDINDPKYFVKQDYTTSLGNDGYFAGNVNESEFNNRLNAQVERLPYLTRNHLVSPQPLGGTNIESFQKNYNNYATQAIAEITANPYMSDEQKKAYVARVNSEMFTPDAKAKGYDAVKAVDKKYGNFTSSRPSFALPVLTEEELKKHPEAKYIDNLFDEKGQLKPEYADLSQTTKDYATKLAKNPLGRDLGIRTYAPPAAPNPADPKVEPVVETPADKPLELWKRQAQDLRGNYFPMDSQLRVPPASMWNNTFATFSPPKLSPIKVDPEQAIRENARAGNATRDIVNQTMGAQGAANMAALLGQEIQGNNNAVRDANVQNAQYAMQTDQLNNQNDWQGQQANASGMSLYNKEQSMSDTNTYNDWRKYRELKSTDRIDANKELMALNTQASLAPYMRFDPNTGVFYNGAADPYTVQYTNPVVQQAMADYYAKQEKLKKTT